MNQHELSRTPTPAESGHAESLLLVVDGLNVVRRVYEANQAPDSPAKVEGALRSSLGSFRRAFAEHSPTHAVFAFDHGGPTWRHDLYPSYRMNRKPMPEVLRHALPAFYEELRQMGRYVICMPGVEADDVIGTVVARSGTRKVKTIVLSTDKDLATLQSETVRVRDHFKPEWRDAAWCQKKFGVPPQLLSDFLALTGDSSDDIPGVQDVGVKTAAKLLLKHGSLEAVLAASSEMKGVLGERLRTQAHLARLSRQLVALKTDLDLGIPSWGALRVQKPL